jgi:eukaryotic-like serine/threonine-protein kinase
MAAGPQTLGRYVLERVLGKGAMGIVYEALDPKLHRKVAIKTILISQLDEETAKDFSMRFVREAHAVARLNHPNIVQVYDFGEEGDIAYLVMEFIRGNELKSALITNQVFDRKQSVRIMCELLDALDFAHEAGVVHRDIKPANVMLDSQGRAKLTDFGVARVTDADRTNAERTQAGTMVGTPAYMSPEQIQGQRVDRRSDIFSAGIILYQFLTGQKPFTGEGAWTVAKKIIHDDPPMPSSINVAVSPEFDRVVAKALAKNPDQRYATAREFAEALRRAAEGKPALPEAEPTIVVPREPPVPQAAHAPEALRSGEMELEFWRSIKDSDDPNDFELYVRQFPQGVYASLAARKAGKLRSGSPADDSGTRTMSGADRTRLQRGLPRAEGEESMRPAVEKTIKLADASAPAAAGKKKSLLLPGILAMMILAGGAAGYFFVVMKPAAEAEAQAAREAAAKAEAQAKRTAEVQAKREAELRARREAEVQAKREADAQARREADAQAKREAEARVKREAQARRDAEAQAKREAEAKAQREAQAKREAEAKAKREGEAQAQREAEAEAQRQAAVKAARKAEFQAKREADLQAIRDAKAKAREDADAKAKLAAETSVWDSVKNSRDPADYQKYLDKYPNGLYADMARRRMAAAAKARLEEPAPKKPTAIVPPTF